MTDIGLDDAAVVQQTAEKRRKPARKSPPAQFTHRLTFGIAPDQADTLAQAKKIFRASESFCLRLAWDHFVRANNLTPQLNNGGK